MKKVLGIYDINNKIYVQRELYKLSLLGYATEAKDNSDFSKRYLTPCFICLKHGSVVSKLFGKYSSNKVETWVKNKLKVT
jgi:hypothetical protein